MSRPQKPRFETVELEGETYRIEVDSRSPEDQIRALSMATRPQDADRKCDTVLALIRLGAAQGIAAEVIFAEAYDDPDGRQFYQDCFSTPLTLPMLIRIIETLLGVPFRRRPLPADVKPERLAELKNQIETQAAFRHPGAVPASFPTQRVRAALSKAPAALLKTGDGRVDPRPLLEWLLSSRHRDLVHSTLRKFLETQPTNEPGSAEAAAPVNSAPAGDQDHLSEAVANCRKRGGTRADFKKGTVAREQAKLELGPGASLADINRCADRLRHRPHWVEEAEELWIARD